MKNAKTINDKAVEVLSRELPNNLESEQVLLGTLLNNNHYINEISDYLESEHFYEPIHKTIYSAILKFVEKGLIANPITLKNYLKIDSSFEELGIDKFQYLVSLTSSAQSIININSYAKIIYESALKRELIYIGENVVNMSYDNHELSAENLIEDVEHKLFTLASRGNSDSRINDIKSSVLSALNMIDKAKKKIGGTSGVNTGYYKMNEITGGLQSSDLIIIAGRPSMGKTALAVNIAVNVAEFFSNENKKNNEEKIESVGLFSLEMSSEQIANRILSIKTGINAGNIRTGNIKTEEFKKLVQESTHISELPIYIDDTPALNISALRTRARRMKRKYNIGLLVVDYLQLMKGNLMKENNRVQEIGEISQGLKAIAKELNIPVIAASQLSRAVETREDKRPQLSDLRESGNIEQDADIVMFIYREEYYLNKNIPLDPKKNLEWQEKNEKVKNLAQIIIAKHRNGPVGKFELRYDLKTTAFDNMDKTH